MPPIDDRPNVAAPDDDPYLWLEEIEGARALEFVDRQNQRTLRQFADAGFEADRDALAAIYDRPDNIPYVNRRGEWLYNIWKDDQHPRGLWRRTTLAEFRLSAPSWEVILDLDKLAADEGEDWLFNRTDAPPGSNLRMLSLSRGGSDAVTLREFDVAAKAFVPAGFVLPEAKGYCAWLDSDTLLLGSAYGAGMATQSGYARTVRLWRRGTEVDRAPVIFETTPDHVGAFTEVDRTSGAERIWFFDNLDFFNNRIWLGDRGGARTRLDLPTDASVEHHQDWLAVKLRTAWSAGGEVHAADTVLGISLSAFLAGDRQFHVVFEPGPRRALQGFFWTAGKLVLSILDELRPVFEICMPSAEGWQRRRLPGLPEIGIVNVWPLDTDVAESNGDLLASVQDPLTPPSLMLIEDFASPAILKQAPRTFSADGLVVTQHEAISVDGERIPYVQTGPAAETGDAPVHLYAYGGFGITMRPAYNSAIGKLWLERGGVSVVASLRGGGEFGTRWHDAGRFAGKRLAHDDFGTRTLDPMIESHGYILRPIRERM